MKFGETLYQRSIPQWAPYNVDYNSLKRLIKQRTTETASGPVSIPGQGPSHAVWKPLDDEIFPILKHEHDRVALFIRSKLGEINRRVAHVERQAQLAEQKTTAASTRPIQQTKRYQRLVEELDGIGNDIEALSRFASAQRLAFRKILKKYRKWTGSPGLHIRMSNEVLGHVPKDDEQVLGRSRNALNPDMSQYLIRLNAASTQVQSIVDKQRLGQNSRSSSRSPPTSEPMPSLSHFEVERALITTPDSRIKRTYWIHPENLDEVKVLLMRRLKPWSPTRGTKGDIPKAKISSTVLLDDESGLGKARNIAVAKMVVRWSDDDFAYIRERSEDRQTLEEVRRKDLLKRLEEKTTPELKQVALINSNCDYFVKDDGTSRVATLETSPRIGHFNHTSLQDALMSSKYPIHMQKFPFSVLTITYNETKLIPRIVTVLDHSHLVQPVPEFTLESHAMYTQAGHFEDPPWKSLLASDIRKVPAAIPKNRADRGQRSLTASSGPSSNEGQDSIFSRRGQHSSQTSVGTSTDAPLSPAPAKAGQKDPMSAAGARVPRRKRKSYGAVQAEAPQRYWNEFDDDPEFNGEEAYAIYVTPDEPFKFPGADVIRKAFGPAFQTLEDGKKRMLSWLPLAKSHKSTVDERRGLLSPHSPTETDREADVESSSDNNIEVPKKANRISGRNSRHGASRTRYSDYSSLGYPRRPSRDHLLYLTSIGLHVLAWMFLIMATVLKGTGRRKAAIEVDAGIISGIVISVACEWMSPSSSNLFNYYAPKHVLQARDRADRPDRTRKGRATQKEQEMSTTYYLPPFVFQPSFDNVCGTGVVTGEIQKLLPQSNITQIHAVDFSPRIIDELGRGAEFERSTHVNAAVTDAENLPFEDDRFSHNINSFGIFLSPDPDKVMAGTYRTLQLGGVAVVTSWSRLVWSFGGVVGTDKLRQVMLEMKLYLWAMEQARVIRTVVGWDDADENEFEKHFSAVLEEPKTNDTEIELVTSVAIAEK